MLKYEVELEYFFQEYKIFLEIESIVSFVKGRDYEVIKHFYYFFLEISQKPIKQESADSSKKKLETVFSKYKERNEVYGRIEFTRNHDGLVPVASALRNKTSEISQAFSLLTNAIKQYDSWRNSLSEKAIQEIYLKNLSDKQKYYFDKPLAQFNQENLKSYLEQNKAINNKILRQSLIEFHNGISHLNAVYWNTGDNNINGERAANHFKRGALDSYKAIIKDFCLLAGPNPMEPIMENLKNLRKCEYQTIGGDKQRNNEALYKEYQNFTAKIISSSTTPAT